MTVCSVSVEEVGVQISNANVLMSYPVVSETNKLLTINSSPLDKVLSEALTWFNTYFREHYSDLYGYIKANNLEELEISYDDVLKEYDVLLSRHPIVVGVKVKLIGGNPVINKFYIYIRANNNDEVLYSLVQKYKDYNLSRIAWEFFSMYKLPGFIKIRQDVDKNITRVNSAGEVIDKTLSMLISFSYNNYTLVIIDLNNVRVWTPGLALLLVYSKTSNTAGVSFSFTGIVSLVRLYSMVNNITCKKLVWSVGEDVVARVLSMKINIDQSVVASELKKYVAIVRLNGFSYVLRPIYFFKHVEQGVVESEAGGFDNVTSAIVFADTGDVYLSSMLTPYWGGSAPAVAPEETPPRRLLVFNIFGEQGSRQTSAASTATTSIITTTKSPQQYSYTTTTTSTTNNTYTSSTTPTGSRTGFMRAPTLYIIPTLITSIVIIIAVLKHAMRRF